MIRVDVNYIIRYFVNDSEKMAEVAEKTLLCAYSKNDEIRTFDKKLLRCIGNK